MCLCCCLKKSKVMDALPKRLQYEWWNHLTAMVFNDASWEVDFLFLGQILWREPSTGGIICDFTIWITEDFLFFLNVCLLSILFTSVCICVCVSDGSERRSFMLTDLLCETTVLLAVIRDKLWGVTARDRNTKYTNWENVSVCVEEEEADGIQR